MAQLLGVLEQGLIYAILALGVYITFKILDFPDMTVDSSFPLGAAVTALMISGGLNPLWSLPASLIAGALAGAITGVIHVRFRVGGLLSGIIVMTGLYSVNLHIAGRSNVQLFSFDTLFKNSLISVVLGSILYRIVIAVVLYLGMPPNDLKLFTAILVAIALSLPLVKAKWDSRMVGM